jgi:biopolymer transport protein ExbB
MSYINQGGMINYILIGMNIVGISIMIYKFIEILIARSKKEKIASSIMDQVSKKDHSLTYESSKDLIAQRVISLESGLGVVKSIASVAPLLGLLGTVIGVLLSFESISKQGMDDPSVFAGGISMALVTTVVGLIVAIPHYLGYNLLVGMLDRLELNLRKIIGERL